MLLNPNKNLLMSGSGASNARVGIKSLKAILFHHFPVNIIEKDGYVLMSLFIFNTINN